MFTNTLWPLLDVAIENNKSIHRERETKEVCPWPTGKENITDDTEKLHT